MSRPSIKERLRRARTPSVRREVAADWAASWMRDHEETLRRIERCCATGDAEMAGRYVGQLKALSAKGFTGLATVIDSLTDEEAAL